MRPAMPPGRKSTPTMTDSTGAVPTLPSHGAAADTAGTPAADGDRRQDRTLVGAFIDRYRVEAQLGSGGMGVVYAAYDPALDRRVALKVLPAIDDEHRDHLEARLRREAQALARLHHPAVVAVHDVGLAAEGLFVAMQLVDGSTLAAWLEGAPRSPREILHVLVEAGRGLAAAHAAGIVHRDVKPSNILIDRAGRALVGDFGLARTAEDGDGDPAAGPAPRPAPERASLLDETLTRAGAVMGTPVYMAPEQHRGEPADERSDQYGFCVSAWTALFGEHPFVEGPWTSAKAIPAMARDAVRVPRTRRVPGRIVRALRRGLRYDPAARWPSIDALLAALAPRFTPVQIGSAVVAVLAIGAIALAWRLDRSPAAAPCAASARALDPVWNQAARDRLAATFAASAELPTGPITARRATEVLDRYGRSWAAMRVDACEATRVRGTQSAELLDRRMRCLDFRLAALDGLVTTLVTSKPTETVNRAVQGAISLPAVSDCADVDALLAAVPPPSDPITRVRYVVLSERLAREHATVAVDGTRITAEAIDALVAQARELGHPGALASALRLKAAKQKQDGEYAAVAGVEREAALAAARAGDDKQAVSALTTAAFALCDAGHCPDGFALLDAAELAAARAGEPPLLVSWVEETRGYLHYGASRYAESDAAYARAVAALERVRGPDDYEIGRTVLNWANTVGDAGDLTRAEAMYRRVLRINRAALGPDHPFNAITQSNLASLLVDAGRLDDARAEAEAALEEKRRVLRPGHPGIATTLQVLANAERQLGELDAAERHARESLEIRRAAFGDDNMATLSSRRHLAAITVARGDVDAGTAELEALVAKLRGDPDKRVHLASALDYLADALVARGDLAGAARVLTETRDLIVQMSGSDGWSAAVTSARLAAVLARRNDCPGARREAERALGFVRRVRVETDPTWAISLATLGECLDRAGDTAGARAALEELAALPTPAGPDRATAARGYALLARIVAAAGDPGRADELAARAAAAAPVRRPRVGRR